MAELPKHIALRIVDCKVSVADTGIVTMDLAYYEHDQAVQEGRLTRIRLGWTPGKMREVANTLLRACDEGDRRIAQANTAPKH